MTPSDCVGRLPAWQSKIRLLNKTDYARYDAVLQIIDESSITAAPYSSLASAVEKKRRADKKTSCLFTLDNGTAVIRLRYNAADSVFAQMENTRVSLKQFDAPRLVAVDMRATSMSTKAAQNAIYTILATQVRLPGDSRPPCQLIFFGVNKKDVTQAAVAAEANTLSRALCRLPPNILTVPAFARFAQTLGKKNNLTTTIINATQLKKMGAGAILAVGDASRDAPCIVRLRYAPKAKSLPIVFVGKGVCYDTGGVNVKPARHMRGMKGDMAGAAAALAAIVAAAQLKLPINIDAYLALADNSISPNAYRPDDSITALNGKSIEIVHSDAEGRMILADTLTLATAKKVRAVASFATLTGTMHVALGSRMSGFFANDEKWLQKAHAAADNSGERLCAFPLADDYKEALKSDVADIKQCAEEGEADHILAALFLREFIQGSPPWLHVDLSASSCKGGLGVAPGPETGFGAAWALELLKLAAKS
ncbi:MAG: M17 family metallopeptidase [Gammaproteobacteria bacterium WSBS_2016_MAG_OTU1]